MINKTVSIVTPSFNQASFIEATIQSIRIQRTLYPDIEHLIIDGRSTDNTLDILRRAKDITWVSEEDNGQADAINKGWRIAHGDILAYLNSDDLYEPGAVRFAVEYLLANPKVSAVYGVCRMIDAKGRQLMMWNPPPFSIKDYLRLGISSVPQPTFFFRREVLVQVGYLDADLTHAMDYDFIARVGQAGIIHRLPHIMASFRMHAASKSVSDNTNQRRESAVVQKRYLSEPRWVTTILLGIYKLKRAMSWPRGGPPPFFTWWSYTIGSKRLGIKH